MLGSVEGDGGNSIPYSDQPPFILPLRSFLPVFYRFMALFVRLMRRFRFPPSVLPPHRERAESAADTRFKFAQERIAA